MVFQVLEVKVAEELFKGLVSLLDLNKELLGVRAGLGASSRAHMQLDSSPLLTIEFEGLQKAKMFIFRPSSLF